MKQALKIVLVFVFILFQFYPGAQTKVANDFGDSDDFSASSGIYLVRFDWEGPNIPGGGNYGEFIHQERPSDYRVFTTSDNGPGFVRARTIRMSTCAEFFTSALGTGDTVYLGIRYKDNLPLFYGPEPVYAFNGSEFVRIGSLGGAFDHSWKVEVIAVSPSDVKSSEGKYRFKIGSGTYGSGLKSDLAIDRIELATTREQLLAEPAVPGYYPAKEDIYPGMNKGTPWYVDGRPFFPVGFAAGWTGMSESGFQKVAGAGFNTLLFYNWMNKQKPYAEKGIWDVIHLRIIMDFQNSWMLAKAMD